MSGPSSVGAQPPPEDYDEEPAVSPAPTFADGMTVEDDRRFLEATSGLTHNVDVTGAAPHGKETKR